VPARPTQAVILAGGRGTRLRPLTDDRPKAMVAFHGKPFLGHVVDLLREQGFERILMLLGYLPQVIMDHFGAGRAYGVTVDYDVTAPDDLTAWRIEHARERLDATFLLLYCDNYWPMRFDDLWSAHLRSGAPAQITVYANGDGFSRDSMRVGADGFVELFDRTRTAPGLKGVEISYAILDKATVLPLVEGHPELLFEEAVYPPLARAGRLHAYWSGHRYYSVGSLERLPITEHFLARRLAVILDRDGVLNERPPRAEYVRRPEAFRWLPGAKDALRRLREAGFQVAVVSNQAGVGRGVMTAADLAAVTARMKAEAAAAGGRIDAVFYCPHAWDAGCECRKPRPGLLFQAQRVLHLDLTRTPFVGDDERDGAAAEAAGCPFEMATAAWPLAAIADEIIATASEETRS
jgi:D-glycero-D-manno-heptose 1,7-bisphosphate phosphatase